MIQKVFPILALSIFSSMLGVGIIAPLLPLYAENLGASGIWLGIIFAGFSISRLIFMPVFGRLSDHYGRKLFICTGLLSYSIISLGYIWANTLPQLASIRFIHGITAGMILPIVQAYVGDMAPKGKEGTWMGYFNAAFFTGFGSGPLIGGTLTDHFGMTFAFSTMSGLNLFAFLIAIFLLPETKSRKMGTSPRLSFREMATSGIVKGIFGFRLAFSAGRGTLATFLPILGSIYIGLSPTLVGTVLTVHIMLMSLLQPYAGRIADKFNRRGLIIIGGFINIIYLTLMPLATSFWQLLGICVLGGLGGAIAIASASAMTLDEGRKFGMGSTIAITSTGMSLGMAIGPLLSGAIADLADINSVFYFGAAIGLAGTSLFIWFTR